MLWLCLNSIHFRTSDSSLYRMKTPNSIIIAICQTKQTAGRLTRILVFFCRPKKFPAPSQQFSMLTTLCWLCSYLISQPGRLLSYDCQLLSRYLYIWTIGGGVLQISTHTQGVDTPNLLARKPLLIVQHSSLNRYVTTAGNKVITAEMCDGNNSVQINLIWHHFVMWQLLAIITKWPSQT